MRTFQICGFSKSGKTATAEALIRQLSAGDVSVASLKDIHFDGFTMDTEGKNTQIHRAAGASPVVARSSSETDFIFNGQMDLREIVNHFTADWLVVEGYNAFPLPKIVCGKTEAEVDALLDRRTFAIAGVFSQSHKIYKGIRVYNPLDAADLLDLLTAVKTRVFPMRPYVDSACCRLCGTDCTGFVEAVIQEEKSVEDCRIHDSTISLKIDGRNVPMVPFVQRLLQNAVQGVVKELQGYRADAAIEIQMHRHTGECVALQGEE